MALLIGLWLGALTAAVGALVHDDLSERRLANEIVAGFYLLAGLGWIVAVSERPDRPSLWPALLGGLAALAVGLGLWAVGLVAAGDVKLAPAAVVLVTGFGIDAWLIALGGAILAGLVTLVWAVRTGKAGSVGLPLAPTLLVGVVPAVAFVVLTGR